MQSDPANHLLMAESVRAAICNWFGAKQTKNVVLAPGMLIALQVLLHARGLKRLLITSDEYYGPQHFPGMVTFVCQAEDLEQAARRLRPEAILMSVVSWRGKRLDVEGTFRRLTNWRSNELPILIADYAHAGAIGFPAIQTLEADVVVGDIDKWVAPPKLAENIAFLSYRAGLRSLMLQAFQPFYLATPRSQSVASRWLPLDQLRAAHVWMNSNDISRRNLLLQYRRNLQLAKHLATAAKSPKPESCIVWLNTENSLVGRLEKVGLVWHRRDGIRILARDLGSVPKKRARTRRARKDNE